MAAVAPDNYSAFLTELKQRIRGARLAASLSVNRELVLLYWSIGRDILARQRAEGWGAKIIDRLAADPPSGLSGRDRHVCEKPEVHAHFRQELAARGICATGCCPIALGS
jgi:hypothetical protein